LFNKKKRDEKFHGMKDEQELRKQLDIIERAAKEAVAADRNAGLEAGQAPPPPLPPGFRSADLDASGNKAPPKDQRQGSRPSEKSVDAGADNRLRQDRCVGSIIYICLYACILLPSLLAMAMSIQCV
jgi:hypothetical protein